MPVRRSFIPPLSSDTLMSDPDPPCIETLTITYFSYSNTGQIIILIFLFKNRFKIYIWAKKWNKIQQFTHNLIMFIRFSLLIRVLLNTVLDSISCSFPQKNLQFIITWLIPVTKSETPSSILRDFVSFFSLPKRPFFFFFPVDCNTSLWDDPPERRLKDYHCQFRM